MTRQILVRTLAPLAVSAALAAQAPRPQFKVEVEYVEVEARVIDADGQPVRGLTKDAFRVREDGTPQDISTLSEINLPAPPPTQPGTQQARAQPILRPDVSSNQPRIRSGRVYLMFVDDAYIDQHRTPAVRDLIRRFIERSVGPGDLMAISTSGRSTAFQNFTNNKTLLVDAANRVFGEKALSPTVETAQNLENRAALVSGPGRNPPPSNDAPTLPQAATDRSLITLKNAQAMLLRATGWMAEVDARSKSIIVIGEGVALPAVNRIEDMSAFAVVEQLLEAARRSSIPIYTIDPRGLTTPAEEAIQIGTVQGITPAGALQEELRSSQDGLRKLAEDTGGAAAVGTNDFDGAFDRIVQRASTFYVLGYYSSNSKRDGRFRSIRVDVDRPGVRVLARSGYMAASDRPPRRAAAPGPAEASAPLREALNSQLPLGGLTLSATAAPFRGRDSNASVAVVLEAPGAQLELSERNGRFGGPFEVLVTALDPLGAIKASDVKTLQFDLPRDTFDRVREHGFRWLSRVSVRPGRYQIRVAASSGASKRGSVWYDLEVPNLSSGELAISGLLVASASASRAPTVRPDPALEGVLPGPPTALREFAAGDDLAVFAEVYDNRLNLRRDVDVTVTIRTDAGREVFRQDDTVTSDQMRSRQGAYRSITRIALNVLPGSYVLGIEARRPGSKEEPVRRAIPFRVLASQ